MKPYRLIFCIGCHHPKLVFANKAKADRYIRFNHDNIQKQSGKGPCRSYYCSFCCAWHVTSTVECLAIEFDRRDNRIWEMVTALGKMYSLDSNTGFDDYLKELNHLFDCAFELFDICKQNLLLANLESALDAYGLLYEAYKKIRLKTSPKNYFSENTERLKQRLQALRQTFLTIEEYDLDSTTRKAFLSSNSIPKDNFAIDYFLAKEKSLRKEPKSF